MTQVRIKYAIDGVAMTVMFDGYDAVNEAIGYAMGLDGVSKYDYVHYYLNGVKVTYRDLIEP